MSSFKSNHQNNLDFIRLVLALLVIFTHGYVVYYGNKTSEPFIIFSHNRSTFGTVAVNFFFIISGYLILQSWIRSRNAFDFLKKRILRIYPAFAFVCILSAFLFVPLGNHQYSQSLQAYFKYLGMVDINYLPQTIVRLQPPFLPETFLTLPVPYEVNFSIWTIPIEFFCYLVLLAFGILKLARKKWLMLAFTIVSIGIMVYFRVCDISWLKHYYKDDFIGQVDSTAQMLPFFMMGVTFYHFEKYIPKINSLAIGCFLITILSARFTNAFFFVQLILGPYFLFCFAFSERTRLTGITRYGDFSYGIYLLGCPLQQLVMYYLGSRVNVYGTLLVSLMVVIPFAIFSWYVIEKPFLKLKKINSLFGRRVASPGL